MNLSLLMLRLAAWVSLLVGPALCHAAAGGQSSQEAMRAGGHGDEYAINAAYQESRYAELIRLFEARADPWAQANMIELNLVCQSYLKVRNYQATFNCLQHMDARYARGDKSIMPNFMYDGASMAHYLRSEALQELGRFEEALAEVALAIEKYAVPPGAESHRGNPYDVPYVILLAMSGREAEARARLETVLKDREHNLNEIMQMIAPAGSAKLPRKARAAMEKAMEGPRRQSLASEALYQSKMLFAVGDFQRAYDRITMYFPDRDFGGANLVADITSDTFFFELELMFAKAAFETGRMNEAKRHYLSVVQNPKIQSSGRLLVIALHDLGRIAVKESNTPQAISFLTLSITALEAQRATINSEVSKMGFAGDNQAVYGDIVSLLFAQGQYDQALEYVERAKARALVDMLAGQQSFGTQKVKASQLISQLTASQLSLEVVPPGEYEGAVRGIVVMKNELQALDPQLASLVTVSAAGTAELSGLLGEDETLVEYYLNAEHLYIFVLSRRGVSGVKVDAENLGEDIEAFREAIQNSNSTNHAELAIRLHRQLFLPLVAGIQTRSVVIVPHGPLHYLPFGALLGDEGYLVQRYDLRILPSATVMKFLTVAGKREGSLLSLGNPDLGNTELDLPGAQTEVEAIAAMVPGAMTLLRTDASETRFKQLAGQYSRVHFAVHGIFEPDAPLTSGLLLAKDGENDGLLTASELYGLDMAADLVTLSACETGLGNVSQGDDVVGLTRGFLYAGASSIVSSLWKVDDDATAFLMTRFYRNLQGSNKTQALRQAQVATLDAFPHPFYWAAFQLTGSGI